MRPRSFCSFCGAPLGPIIENRQSCTGCGLPHYHNAAPCAACVVVDDAGRVLLARRGIEPRRGLWDLPGGFCGPAEPPAEAAVRELAEELACPSEVIGFLGHVMDTYGEGGDPTMNAIFVMRLTAGTPEARDDVIEVAWFHPSAIPPDLAFVNTGRAIELWLEWQATSG